MLVTIITILFLTGGASAGLLYDFGSMKKQVKTYVTDEERKDAALDVVKEFKARAKAENKKLKALKKQVEGSLNESPAADEQLTYLGEELINSTRAYYADMLDLRFKIREQFTREEWTAAYAAGADQPD